jgi:hypothetical protein
MPTVSRSNDDRQALRKRMQSTIEYALMSRGKRRSALL